MICKFQDVSAEQLKDLRDLVDSDNNHDGSGENRVVRLLKTAVNSKNCPTTWTVELAVNEVILNTDRRKMTTARGVVSCIFEILDRFPAEPRLLDEPSRPGTPPCKNCGNPTIPQCGMFLCRNCGEENIY